MFPKFIGIGAQRSGSTWLHRNLSLHPDIWLAPVKELHYFDGRGMGKPDAVWEKFFTRQWPHKRYRRLLLSRLKAKTKSCRIADWAWDYRFFFKPQSDQWYASLFDQGKGKCTGEITPAYALLDRSMIVDIHSMMPEAKILFMMRNPIDRSWSHVVKDFAEHKKRSLDSVTDEEWKSALGHRGVTLRSDYIRTLDLWGEHYPKDQIFVGFFDDILERPRELLLDVYRFLGVRASEELLPVGLAKAVNTGYRASVPERWERYLSREYIDQLRVLSNRFSGPTSNWLVRAEAML